MGMPNDRAILWKLLSCFCFASTNAFIQSLSRTLPSGTIAFVTTIFSFLWLMPFLVLGNPPPWRTKRLDLQTWRVISACCGIIFWYRALSAMPLAQAVALNFTGPLVTIVGAWIFLGEKLTPLRLWAIGIGLGGGILIANARYLTGELAWGSQGWSIFFPLMSAGSFSVCTLLNKKLTSYDPPLTIVAYTTGCTIPLLGVCALPNFTVPTAYEGVFLALAGLFSFGGNFALVRSFVKTDISFLLPLGTARLVFSGILGWVCFKQPLNFYVLGGVFILLCALFILSQDKPKAP